MPNTPAGEAAGKSPTTGRARRVPAVVAAVAVAAGVAGCGGSSTAKPESAAAVAKSAVITTPAATGRIPVLNWNLPYGEPTSLDPAKVGDYSPQAVESNLCEGLVRLTPSFEVVPGLAEKVTQADPKTLVYDLRPGVTFTDGTPLTPEDVVYSLERHGDRKLGSFWSEKFTSVASIRKTGPAQVTIRLTKPDVILPQILATAAGAISQKRYVERAGASYGTPDGGVMCTGPFSLKKWRSGESITLQANPSYWDSKLRPKAESVVFQFLTDASTMTSALLSGEIDGIYEAPTTSTSTLQASSAGELYTGPSTQMSALLPARTSGPMADPRVRTALDLAIDKPALARNVFGGAATPLNTFVPPFAWGDGPTRKTFQAGYDALEKTGTPQIAKAKALLAEAAPSSKSFVAVVGAGDQSGLQTLTFVQAAAKQIGLEMTIRQMPPTQHSDVFYNPDRRKDIDLVYALGYLEIANPLQYAPYYATPKGLFNWTAYDDPAVARQLERAIETTDPQRSAELFVEAQAAYTPKRLVIPLVAPYERLYMNKRISGAPASFAYTSMPWAAMVGGTK